MPDPRPPLRMPVSAETRAKINDAIRASYDERLAEFRKLDRGRIPVVGQYNVPGVLTDREIAKRIGVTRRTVWRYRAAERAAGQGWWKDGKPRQATPRSSG